MYLSLIHICDSVGRRLRADGKTARVVTVQLVDNAFRRTSHQTTLSNPCLLYTSCTQPDTFVCNGPYMISDWIPSERIVLSKNPNYNGGWDTSKIVSRK